MLHIVDVRYPLFFYCITSLLLQISAALHGGSKLGGIRHCNYCYAGPLGTSRGMGGYFSHWMHFGNKHINKLQLYRFDNVRYSMMCVLSMVGKYGKTCDLLLRLHQGLENRFQ
jgi:hypothetical protein